MEQIFNKQILIKIFFLVLIIISIKLYFENLKLNSILKNYESLPESRKLLSSNGEISKNSDSETRLSESYLQIDKGLSSIKESIKQINQTLFNLNQESSSFKIVKKANAEQQPESDKTTSTIEPQVIKQKPNDANKLSGNEDKSSVLMFDLSKPLEPVETYSGIQCRKSAVFHVSTTLCVHNIQNDIHVSGSIWRGIFFFYFKITYDL